MSGMMESARGGRGAKAPRLVDAEIVRGLEPKDLALLASPPPVAAPTGQLSRLSHSHHQLAQLLARGVPGVEASLITGYSQSRISVLRTDPAFQELLEHYGAQRELANIDVLDRMRALGIDSLEELQARLESNPDGFSARELMELTELLLVKGRAAPGSRQGGGPSGGAGTGAGVVLNVKFVTAEQRIAIDGKLVEGE